MYKVNLLPRELRPGTRKLNILVTALVISYCIVLLSLFIFYKQTAADLDDILLQKRIALEGLEREAFRVGTVRENRRKIMEGTQVLQNLVSERLETADIIADIDSIVPVNLSLDSLDIAEEADSGCMVTLEGKSNSASLVGILVKALAELAYLSEVELVKLSECKDERLVVFHIIAHLGKVGR